MCKPACLAMPGVLIACRASSYEDRFFKCLWEPALLAMNVVSIADCLQQAPANSSSVETDSW
jgi:hypothetical protein